MKKIVIIAGDKSGDLYGGLLSKKLKEKFPSLELYSFGGRHLARNSHQVIDTISHSVSGIYEVVFTIRKIINIFNTTLAYIDRLKPDLIILIDFPDFNLRLAQKINKKYPVFYYVSPQIWAWRKQRINLIRKYIDKMTVIFKFEGVFYKENNIDALYFGHPLLEIIEEVPSVSSKNIITFMPGSRRNELKRHLPVLAKTYKILRKHLKGYAFRIINPDNIEKNYYRKYIEDIEIVPHSYKAIRESEFIISSSGTATVEIAILEIPYIVIYKVNPISWHIIKTLVKTKYAGMVNILSSKTVVKELLQENAAPDKIAALTLDYINDKEKYTALRNELKKVKEMLLPQGATDKFSDYIGRYLSLE